MRSRGISLALLLSALSAGAAVECFLKVSTLRHDAEWLMARGSALADEYANSFDGARADQELATFASRREVLEQAILWDRGARGLVMASVLCTLGAYGLFLRRRLEEQLVDSSAPFHEGELPTPAFASARAELAR